MEVLQGLLVDSLHPVDNNIRNAAQEKLAALAQTTPELCLALLVRNFSVIFAQYLSFSVVGVCCQQTT